MTWRGVLERRAVSGGTWVLRTPEATWTLYGAVPSELLGKNVEVEGEEGGYGIGMSGPAITVRRIRGS